MQLLLDLIYKPSYKPIVITGDRVRPQHSDGDDVKLMKFDAATVEFIQSMLPMLGVDGLETLQCSDNQ